MCFNSTEDFGQTRTGGVPVPGRKPSRVVDEGGSVLGSIWNSAKGVFEGIASIELQRYEAERLADIREAEDQARLEKERALAGFSLPDLTEAQQRGVVLSSSMLAILLLGGAAVLISRR